MSYINDGYGTEVGKFISETEGSHLPNVDISEEALKMVGDKDTKAVATGRGKTRVYDSASDRMQADSTFKPELDVQKLIEGMDGFKAIAASGATFRQAIGGKTKLEVIKETHPALYEKMMGLKKQLASLKGSLGTLEKKIQDAIDTFNNSLTKNMTC